MKLVTSYYARALKLPKDKFFVVRTSIGAPRWGQADGDLLELAPTRDMLDLEETPYRRKYVSLLKKVGVDAIRNELSRLSKKAAGRTLVLCCFESLSEENVEDGQFCHRRIFADWWEKQTGEVIPEYLPPAPSRPPAKSRRGTQSCGELAL